MKYGSLLGKAFEGTVRLNSGRTLLHPRLIKKLTRCGYTTGTDYTLKSIYGTAEFPRQTLHECLYDKFEKYGKKIAVECGITGRKYTFLEMKKLSGILASSLQNKLKLNKGDILAVCLPNLPEFPIVLLAGSQCGVIVTPINCIYKEGEIAHQLKASCAKAVFTTINLFPVVDSALKLIQKSLPIVIVKEFEGAVIPSGASDFAEFLDPSTCGDFKKVDVKTDDVVVLPYSSGTTGMPKGVELMHKNIVSNLHQVYHAKLKMTRGWNLEEEIVLGLLPMFHIYGLSTVTLSTLLIGGTLITLSKFEPILFSDTIYKKKITSLYLVPPLILFLSNYSVVSSEHLKHVRYIINGASPIGQADMEKFLEKGKHIIAGQGYGLTETSPVVLLFNRERVHKFGAAGVPVISTEIKIVDPETLKSQPVNKVGEIWVRGPQVMKGYFNNREATENALVDGWLRTGDLAHYDEDGDVFISDRMKELIKVKGFQVPPAELEELLRTHPSILEAAVIGIPHKLKGEVPKAFVVLKKGKEATEAEIKEFVKNKVAAHKALDGGVVFVDSIPKSASGKILKKSLK